MAQKDLEAVIGRAVIDEEFRRLLFADPNVALAPYELNERELAALRKVDLESLDAFGDSPGIRIIRILAMIDDDPQA